MADELTFLYLPPDQTDPVARGPLYVCEDRQMSGFEAWVPTEEEIAAMQNAAIGPNQPPEP
jgi:hypothetical protein